MQYVKSAEDADEIVNDTFMAIWEKKDELELDENLKSYLYTIVRNKSLNWLKKRKLELSELDEAFDPVSPQHSPLEFIQAKQTEETVLKLIDELPARCRQIFVLSRKEYMSNKQIAELMGLNEKTVENQITIAIKFIRTGLRRNDKNNGLPMMIFPWVIAWLMN